MESPILSVEQLRTVVVPLLALATGEQPSALSPPRRAELIQLLSNALLGPVACQEYCSFLETERDRPGSVPLADLPIGDFPVPALLRDGLAVLPDDRLMQLALSPRALRSLQRLLWQTMMVEDLAGESWRKLWDERAAAIPLGEQAEQAKQRVLNRIAKLQADAASANSAATVPLAGPESVGQDLDRLVEEALKQVRYELQQQQAGSSAADLLALSARQIASRILTQLQSQLPSAIANSRECLQTVARLVNAASRDEAQRTLSHSAGEVPSEKLTVVGDSSTSTLLTARFDPQRVLTELDRLESLRGEFPQVADLYDCWRFAGRTVNELATLFGLSEDELESDLKFAVHRIKD